MSSFSQRAFKMVASVTDGLPVFQIQDFRAIGKDKFAVIFSSIRTNTEYDQNDYDNAVTAMTDSKMGIVRDSIFRIERGDKPLFRCITAANFESFEATEKNIKEKGLHSTVANVLEDDNGGIWKIVSNGDKKQIVQVTQEDYSGLLAKRRQRATMTANVQDEFNIGYEDTDYVNFINPEIEAMDFGFVIKAKNSDYVVSRTTKNATKIEAHQVVEAISTSGVGLDIKAKRKTVTASSSFQDYINYLKELYGKNSDYVKAWEKAIRSSPDRVA